MSNPNRHGSIVLPEGTVKELRKLVRQSASGHQVFMFLNDIFINAYKLGYMHAMQRASAEITETVNDHEKSVAGDDASGEQLQPDGNIE